MSVPCNLVVTCCERADVCDVLLYFVTFPYGVLGQVWYFIVWIPDRCLLPYFVVFARGICIYIRESLR